MNGYEVVQLYLQDLVGSVARPVKELKDFRKVYLNAGEAKTVEFTVTEEKLRFWNKNMQFVSEPGGFKVFVGTSSNQCLETKFELVK